jgi:hypothetical protein
MDEKLSCIFEADRRHAVETGEKIFVRAAEEPEIELFKRMSGEPEGFGPRSLYLIVGEKGRVFVSWPRDISVPQHTEQDLRAVLDAASASGLAVLVIDPIKAA